MGKVNFVFGRTTGTGTGTDNETKHLLEFGTELVQFANESHEKIHDFCKKIEPVQKEQLTQCCYKSMEKIVDILNQFVIVAQQRHDYKTINCLVSNLSVFLFLIHVEINVCSTIVFMVLNEGFRSCERASRLGSIAVNVGDCLRYQESQFAKVENFILESAEIMFRIGGFIKSDDGDDIERPFQQLKRCVVSAKLESTKCDEKITETFAKIRKALISPEKRKLIIKVAVVVGGFVGLGASVLITWYLTWFIAVIGILIGTTGCAILGALIGFKIVNRRETNLLEDLVKCSNQRDYLRKNFENFKYKLQNSELYLKYADHGHGGQPLGDGINIPMETFTEC